MKYTAKFPNPSIQKKFEKTLQEISKIQIQDDIMKAIEDLENNPRPFGKKVFKALRPPLRLAEYAAQYRLRIGDYRVLYDVDDQRKIVWILALRKRDERTYA